MRWRNLAVEGAVVFRPDVYPDDRGHILTHLHTDSVQEATGRPPFPVAQGCWSRSRRGVVRGVHYTATPPGMAKYVHCSGGSVLDVVVDLRVGSPTYRRSETVLLDQQDFATLHLPVGVGHGYLALTDDAVVTYLLSSPYATETELAVSALDPAVGLPFDDVVPVLSERDRAAPTLAEAEAAGLLPDYRECLAADARLAPAAVG